MSGIIYDFFLYAGSSTFDNISFTTEEEEMGLGAQVRSIDEPHEAYVHFDNYFSGVKLVHYLKNEMHIVSRSTVQKARIQKLPLKDFKPKKIKGQRKAERVPRGTIDHVSQDGVLVVRWEDNRTVDVVSTIAGVNPLGTVNR